MQNEMLSVLVAPMDWGLGHATRCIPLVKALQNFGMDVIIAAEGAQLSLLKNEFPHLKFIHLQGYRIQYSHSKRLLPFKIAIQIPKILFTIRSENIWLKKTIKRFNIKAVISDNRYGLHNTGVTSVFMTHQLTVNTPNKKLTDFVRFLNYKLIKKFDECWIPDHADVQNNLAGKLSHPIKLPELPIYYIGALSRFKVIRTKIKYDYTAVISGPEPQRTLFENKIRKHFPYLNGNKCIVLGKPGKPNETLHEEHIDIYNHLNAEELQQVIGASANIICRAGYSTIMDLVTMKKTALLVPTPGQTEQEYLSDYLSKQESFSASPQHVLNAAVITQFGDNKNALPEFPEFDLEDFLKSFISRIKR